MLDTNNIRKKKNRVKKIDSWCLDMDQPKEIVATSWKIEIDGSPMYKCSRKLQKVKNDLFSWCKEYQLANNIVWDDIVESCTNSQKQVNEHNQFSIMEGTMSEKRVREESFEKAVSN